jgi:hypothetical protein
LVKTAPFSAEVETSQHVDEMEHEDRPPSLSVFMVKDSIRTPSDTTGRFAKSFDNDLDSTILAQESERERALAQKSERERAPAQESERERAPNTGVQLDSRQVRPIGTYVAVDIYVL